MNEEAVMDDGYRLPMRRWGDVRQARAMVLALHGFNDYSNAFADLGPYLAAQGVVTYAYDQRGFGVTDKRGLWAGTDRMIADLRALAALLRQRHPRLPLYLLGESMGGAVVMAGGNVGADGVILIAPAVWSRDTMNPAERVALWVTAHTVPWLEVTGRGLDIRPSDNRAMLRAFSADPLVIKETRIDALWGLVNLMDRAAAAAKRLQPPMLILYGENDEIVPKRAFCRMVESLPTKADGVRVVLYGRGWHMLTRDLQRERVLADIGAWLRSTDATLPSGEQTPPGGPRLARFCGAPTATRVAAAPPTALN
jgi:acylglycerol lipase